MSYSAVGDPRPPVRPQTVLRAEQKITSISLTNAALSIPLPTSRDQITVMSNDPIECRVEGQRLIVEGVDAMGDGMVVSSGACGSVMSFGGSNMMFNFGRGGQSNTPWLVTRNQRNVTVQSHGAMCTTSLGGMSMLNGLSFKCTLDALYVNGVYISFPTARGSFDTVEGVGTKPTKINGKLPDDAVDVSPEAKEKTDEDAKKLEAKKTWVIQCPGMLIKSIKCGNRGDLKYIDPSLLSLEELELTASNYGCANIDNVNLERMECTATNYGKFRFDQVSFIRARVHASNYGVVSFDRCSAETAKLHGTNYGEVSGNLSVVKDLTIVGSNYGRAECLAARACQVDKEQSAYGTCRVTRV